MSLIDQILSHYDEKASNALGDYASTSDKLKYLCDLVGMPDCDVTNDADLTEVLNRLNGYEDDVLGNDASYDANSMHDYFQNFDESSGISRDIAALRDFGHAVGNVFRKKDKDEEKPDEPSNDTSDNEDNKPKDDSNKEEDKTDDNVNNNSGNVNKVHKKNDIGKLLYDPNKRKNDRLGSSSGGINEESNASNNDDSSGLEKKGLDENASNNADESKKSGFAGKAATALNVAQNIKENGVKGAAREAKEIAKQQAKKKIMAFIMKNPYVLLILAVIIVILLIIIILMGGGGVTNYYDCGLGGYDYVALSNTCDTIYVHDTPGGDDGSYSLEEYIAGVVSSEVGVFDNDTMFEVGAITARTFALNRLQNSSDCSIAGNETAQVFRPATNDKIISAVERTRGLVLTRDNKLISTQYDAFCWDTKDENYYYLCQKEYDSGDPLRVPVEWANDYVKRFSGQPFLDNPRYRSHGNGMSQDGAYYLATQVGMSKDQILKYFYGSDTKLMTINDSYSYGGEYALNPNDPKYSEAKFLTNMSLADALKTKGSSIDQFNKMLADVAEYAGVGTRAAVVNSAVTLIGTLADFGYKLTYLWGGKYYTTGVNPNWGSRTNNSWYCDNYSDTFGTREKCTTNYAWNSFDCSGFVNWSIINGYQLMSYTELESKGLRATTGSTTFSTDSLDSNNAVCLPGDVLFSDGHVVLVVGVDEESKRYIVAESTGGSIAGNTGGVKLSYYGFGASGYTCGHVPYESEGSYLSGSCNDVNAKNNSKFEDLNANNILLVGDSRTVGLCIANNICNGSSECNNETCLASVGSGYGWFTEQINTIKNSNQENIIINMGVNDLVGTPNTAQIANNYFYDFKEMAESVPSKKFYIMSVNPVEVDFTISSDNVEAFNKEMRTLINKSKIKNLIFMNTYSELDFKTTDGLHYDSNTYKSLYKHLIGED